MNQSEINKAIRNLQAIALDAYGFPDTAFIFENWNEPEVAAVVIIVPSQIGPYKGGPS